MTANVESQPRIEETLPLDSALAEKYETLKRILADLGGAVIAFSGGVDSTLLTKVAYDVLGDRAVAVSARSETYPAFELEEAVCLAKSIGVRHLIINTDELSLEGFRNNPPDRCYWCKRELFTRLREEAKRLGLPHVADGANADDQSDFRPGLRAGRELGVRSPLREAGLTKEDVRRLSRHLGLPTWNKPSYACLASRFPYGSPITPEALARVERAERVLREIGLRQFRVRHHGHLARIEADPKDIAPLAEETVRDKIVARFKEIGYTYVALDLEGYRSGSMNEALPKEIKRFYA